LTVTTAPTFPEKGVNPVIVGTARKLLSLRSVPDGVVTEIFPVVAVSGTIALSCAAETKDAVAGIPLKATWEDGTKPDPRIDTVAPRAAEGGVNPVSFDWTVKSEPLAAVPPAVVTKILPVVAVGGTIATIEPDVRLSTVAGAPLKVTIAPLSKFAPETVTLSPALPDGGANPEIVDWTRKVAALAAVHPWTVAWIFPVTASAGTAKVSVLSVQPDRPAATPPIFTVVALSKYVPETLTVVPEGPVVGEIPVIDTTWKGVPVTTVPPADVTTESGPDVAPGGTLAMTLCGPVTETEEAGTPLNLTWVEGSNPLPSIVTGAPIVPICGVNDAIEAVTTKLEGEYAVP